MEARNSKGGLAQTIVDSAAKTVEWAQTSIKSTQTKAEAGSSPGPGDDVEPDKLDPNASQSVRSLVDRAGPRPVTATELAARLFESHADYASGVDVRGLIEALRAPRHRAVQTARGWIMRAAGMYQPELLLNGRRTVLSLALAEPALWAILQRFGAVEALLSEIESVEGDLDEQLSPLGREQLALSQLSEDVTETRSDAPADQDLLFRKPLAEALALRIRSMRAADKKRPLMLLLDGPWGSGKSTVMGFVRDQLEAEEPGVRGGEDRWITVHFNAWQHQRLEQPWWAIANAVISGCIRGQLDRFSGWWRGMSLALRHFVFRTFTGRITTALAAIAAVAIVIGLLSLANVPELEGLIEGVSKALGLIAVVFGVVLGTMKFLAGSDKASAQYLASRNDPMGALETHLIDCLRETSRPVIVFVDDLDRCDSAAVVRLLEGVQVLFKAAPVVFLFAGDQRWVTHSFELEYEKFKGVLKRETRPLGSVFLEKTFQLALWLPPPIEEGKRRYWNNLLGLKDVGIEPQAAADLSDVATEADIIAAAREVEASGDYSARLAFRREAVRKLATPELERELQTHTLRPLLPLIEPNPRAMKRLVMAYGMARSVDILTGRSSPPHALALWTVITMRWPDLAAWLRDHPERVELAASPVEAEGWSEADAALFAQLRSEQAQRVIRGPSGYAPLTAEALKGILGDAPQQIDAAPREVTRP